MGRDVALEVLRSYLIEEELSSAARFLAEAHALARARHPNIVTVFEVGGDGEVPYFVMELIEGQTLASLIPSGPSLPLERAVAILADLAPAIDSLHQHGIVHRDIKPQNVMLDPAGRAILMDLGISRILDASLATLTGPQIGTSPYMSQEQVRGEHVGPASDIYALGILAYHLLAGRPPFLGDSVFVMHAHVYDAPPPLEELRPRLPESVYAAIAAAIAKEPEDRPATARDFLSRLTAAQPTIIVPHHAPPSAPAPPEPQPARQAAPDPGPPPAASPLPVGAGMYFVNVDKPLKQALVHADACMWYRTEKREQDGGWYGPFASRDAALDFAQTIKEIDRVGNARRCCERL